MRCRRTSREQFERKRSSSRGGYRQSTADIPELKCEIARMFGGKNKMPCAQFTIKNAHFLR
jgi:hypothetical protein